MPDEQTGIFNRDYVIRVKRFFFFFFFRGSKANRKRTFIFELPVLSPPPQWYTVVCGRTLAPGAVCKQRGRRVRYLAGRTGIRTRLRWCCRTRVDTAATVAEGGNREIAQRVRSSSLLFFPIYTQYILGICPSTPETRLVYTAPGTCCVLFSRRASYAHHRIVLYLCILCAYIIIRIL